MDTFDYFSSQLIHISLLFKSIDSYLAYVGLPDRFFESFMYYLKYPISGYVERSVCLLSTTLCV